MEKKKSTAVVTAKLDRFLWVVALLLMVAGVVANYYFSRPLIWGGRLVGWLLLVGVVGGLLRMTTQGKKFWKFAHEAKLEIYKVVWPTRDEAIKMTMIIAALVIAMALLMWGIDSVLFRVVGWAMGRL